MKNERKLLAVKVRERSPYAGDEPDCAVLHVVCDRENRPAPNLVILGIGGNIQDSDRVPLMITTDGRGDYGSHVDPPSRFFHTNIRDKIMKRGELFSVDYRDEDRPLREETQVFEIVDVVSVIQGVVP